MRAVDTNLIIRYVTQDNAKQSAKAKKLIDSEDVFVSTTVLLETEWVLRRLYGLTAAESVGTLRDFAGLPTVTIEEPAASSRAFDWAAAGMDFADALHLAKAEGGDAFVTFDKALARHARKLANTVVELL
jgi:predicted nucleic-acid-binding protein